MNGRRFLSIGMIAIFGIISAAFFIFLARRSDAARADFYQAQHELDLSRKGIWHLEKLDPKQLDWELMSMNARFPSSEQLGVLIGELTDLAKTSDISITSITPSEKVEIQDESSGFLSVLSRVPIEMRLRGKYERIAIFLSQLGALNHGVMKIEHFRLEKEGAEDTSSLLLSLVASVFVRKSPDQKILNEGISMTFPLERQAGQSRFAKIERNPFTKAVVQTEVESPVTLQGIIYDSAQPIALVNGETKSVGEVVNGMKIIEIHPDSVVFEKEGKKIKIRLRWD